MILRVDGGHENLYREYFLDPARVVTDGIHVVTTNQKYRPKLISPFGNVSPYGPTGLFLWACRVSLVSMLDIDRSSGIARAHNTLACIWRWRGSYK